MDSLKGLMLPFRYNDGVIVDGSGKTVILANVDASTTPLTATSHGALLMLICELLNKSFEHDQAAMILKKLGY